MGAHKHAAAVMRVYRDRHRDKTTFCVLSCETPQEYSLTGSRDPGTVGVSCLCLAHILFIILFCNGGRKFAQARDFSPLIISTLARRVGGRKRWGDHSVKIHKSASPLSQTSSISSPFKHFLHGIEEDKNSHAKVIKDLKILYLNQQSSSGWIFQNSFFHTICYRQ